MNFDYTPKVRELQERLVAFMGAHVYPNERRFRDEVAGNRAQGNPWIPTQLVEAYGAAGLNDDFLVGAYASARSLRLADGPDEVHRNAIAKLELRRAAGAATDASISAPMARGR